MPSPAEVLDALAPVIDPELGLSIVELGLVYGVDVDDDGTVRIRFTTTSPGCPMTGVIGEGIARAASRVAGVTRVGVGLVWDPPWTPDRITKEGLRVLAAR